jgi:acetylglutamate kinase
VRDFGELVVVKLGGTTLAEEHDTLAGVAEQAGRYSLVLVHGGGKRLTDWLDRLGVESHFEDGRRVTDDAALDVAVAVLGGLVNSELVAELLRLGAPAVGLSGVDGELLAAERIPKLGRVARVVGARPTVLYALFAADQVPVIAPLALDENQVICNVNADDAAAGLAGALGARLILLTDTDGVLDSRGRRMARLDELAAEQLMTEGVISGGMVPKVQAALAVLRSGGSEVVIADGRAPNALRRALERDDFGTRFVPGPGHSL